MNGKLGVRAVVSVVAVLLVGVLSGCGGSWSSSDGGLPSGYVPPNMRTTYGQYTHSVQVSQAYMDRILNSAEYLRHSNHDVVDAVLADRVITADEVNELERNAVACMAGFGYEVNRDYWFSEWGGIGATSVKAIPDGDRKNVDFCEADTGYQMLAGYYDIIMTNPDNVDLGPYRFRCLVEHGLVESGVSYEEYVELGKQDRPPLIGDPRRSTSSVHGVWKACQADPLHNIADSPLKK